MPTKCRSRKGEAPNSKPTSPSHTAGAEKWQRHLIQPAQMGGTEQYLAWLAAQNQCKLAWLNNWKVQVLILTPDDVPVECGDWWAVIDVEFVRGWEKSPEGLAALRAMMYHLCRKGRT